MVYSRHAYILFSLLSGRKHELMGRTNYKTPRDNSADAWRLLLEYIHEKALQPSQLTPINYRGNKTYVLTNLEIELDKG
jgi:hypothetical protein